MYQVLIGYNSVVRRIKATSLDAESGRKKIYTPEQNVRIAEIRSSGKSIRETAREAGCSTGHVQDVLRSYEGKTRVYGNQLKYTP